MKQTFYAVFWAISANSWTFFSGVVAGLGANVFATRALDTRIGKSTGLMWLEFITFLISSAFAISAGEVRRKIRESWKAGGSHPEHKNGFIKKKFKKLVFCAIFALLFLIMGLHMVLRG